MIFFSKKPEPQPVPYTEQTCGGCGEKERRPFEQGDHVYKGGTRCTKCNSTSTLMTAIYGEYPPEKKN